MSAFAAHYRRVTGPEQDGDGDGDGDTSLMRIRICLMQTT